MFTVVPPAQSFAFRRDVAKRAIAAAGYAGEKLLLMAPQDIVSVKTLAEITADVLGKFGLNLEVATMDWASSITRRPRLQRGVRDLLRRHRDRRMFSHRIAAAGDRAGHDHFVAHQPALR